MRRRIDARGNDAKQRVAGSRQIVIIDNVARADQLDAGFVEPALGELPGKRARLTGRHEHKQRVRMKIGSALEERRKIWIGKRHLQRVEDLAAALRKMLR